MTKAAVYTGTSNLYGGMIAASKSLIANSDVDEIWFLIEDDEFPVKLPDMIHTINASKIWREYIDEDSPNMKSRFSYMAVIRPAFCHILPHLDRVLSLDVDTMVRTDISSVWDTDLDGYYIAGCMEPHHSRDGIISINAGVVLMNLEMLRDGRADIIMDQDAMTCLCQGRIQTLDKRYNGTIWTGCGPDCFIKHYAGIKDWYSFPEAVNWYRMPWSEVMARHERVILSHASIPEVLEPSDDI